MKSWKRIVYTMAAIQVGTGITIIGVVSFIPLFLTSELGVTDPGDAAFWAGVISGVTPLFVALVAPFWSLQADKWGQKRVLAVLLAILMAATFANAFAQSPLEVLFYRILQGLSGGFVAIAMTLIMNATPREHLPWALGIFQAAFVSGVMFGPLLGGLAADHLGYRMPFLIFAALTALCLIGTLLLIPRRVGPQRQGRPEPFTSRARRFMRNPVIGLMILLQFLCNAGMTGIGPILPLYIKEMMGSGAEAVATIVGIIIFAAGGVSCCASLSVSRFTARFSMPYILIGACAVTAVNFILQYMMPTVTTLGIMRALAGLSLGLILPTSNTVLASAVPPEERTILMGFTTSFALLGNVFGPIASGWIAMHFGYAMVFWSTAVCFFAASFLIYQKRQVIRDDLHDRT